MAQTGHPTKIFVNKPPDSLLCGLCLDVLNIPIQCANGHCFCKDCIIGVISQRALCPICNIDTPTIASYNANIVARDVIENLPTKCHAEPIRSSSADYCRWTGPLNHRATHVKDKCQYQVVSCRNEGCDAAVARKDINNHLLFECLRRSAKCEYCSRTMLYTALRDHITYCPEKSAGKPTAGKVPTSAVLPVDAAPPSTTTTPLIPPEVAAISVKSVASAKSVKSDNSALSSGSAPSKKRKGENSSPAAAAAQEAKARQTINKGAAPAVKWSIYPLLAIVLAVVTSALAMYVQQYDIFPSDPTVSTLQDWLVYLRYAAYRLLFPLKNECEKGYCLFRFETNDTYIGQWEEYQMHGRGYYWFASSGDSYAGHFHQDLMHGHGVYTGSTGVYDGAWRYGNREGPAVFTHPNGDVFNGTFGRNMFNGFGTLTYGGNEYVGDFEDDMYHGWGRLTESGGGGRSYEGAWVNNEKEGEGVLREGGNEYAGFFLGNERSGYGVQQWEDGSRYEGYWAADRMHGQGTLLYANGDVYQGDLVRGRRHGYGSYFTQATQHEYQGGFLEDMKHGRGRQSTPHGSYEGDFFANEISGVGRYDYSDGSSYEGAVQRGLRHGRGTFTSTTRDEYSGEWVENRLDECAASFVNGNYFKGRCEADSSAVHISDGFMQYANGDTYEGKFVGGLRDGLGTLNVRNTGEKFVGFFKENRRISGLMTDAQGNTVNWDSEGGSGSGGAGGVGRKKSPGGTRST